MAGFNPDFMNKFVQMPLLTKKEERKLAVAFRWKGDQKAKETLILRNQGLVVALAKTYMKAARRRGTGAAFSIYDLIQEGNIGLQRAVDLFDHRLNLRFSTYATWWIKQAIRVAIFGNNSIIFVPRDLQAATFFKTRVVDTLTKELERRPTQDEVDERVLVSKKNKTLKKALESVNKVLLPGSVQSYNRVISRNGKESSIASFICDSSALPPDIQKQAEEAQGELVGYLNELTDMVTRLFPKIHVQHIFFMREGLIGYPANLSLEEVGEMCAGMGNRVKPLTRERVRQIQLQVWDRLMITTAYINTPEKLSEVRERLEVINSYLAGVKNKTDK